MVEEIVVFHIDEKLSAGRVRVHGAGHGQGAIAVGEAVVRFVLNGIAGRLLGHAGLKAAALNHKAVDNTVEDGVVVKTFFDVLLKVGSGFRRFLKIQFNFDIAVVGLKYDHGVLV